MDRQREQIDGLYELAEKGGRESNPDLTERQDLRKRYKEQKNNRCPYGQRFIRDCPVVLERQQVLQMNEIQDAHFMEQAEAKCSEAIREINAELAGIEKRKAELTRDLGSEKGARSKAQNDLYKARQDGDELAKILNEHERWSNWHDKPDEYRELHKLRASLDELSRNITLVESTLAELLKAHNYNRETLSTIFHDLVKVVLPDARFDGEVRLDGGEISFCINRNGKIGGEAISTLSVLVADMSALIFTIVSEQSQLPGFLMHDSPREADMDYTVYHSYIRTWGGLQSEFPDPASCPFQYIITTTSEPPEEFRTEQYLKLELDASTPEGLLLKCVVDNKTDDMFDH